MDSVLQTLRRAEVQDIGNYSMEVTKVITQAIKKRTEKIDLKRKLIALHRNDLIIPDRIKFEKALDVLAKDYSDPTLDIIGTFTPSTIIHVRKKPLKIDDKKIQPISELDVSKEPAQERISPKTRPAYLFVCYTVFLGIIAATASEILGSWIILGGLYGQLVWLIVAVFAAIILGYIEHSR